ncbi:MULTISPECIES: hypothetical protein [unclassified Bradyrhizobium]|uniref:hypothetical protein n=1 Tax=unclassified Bradyrhizobium TaxID=2631580 RepID=UPI0020B30958|nr:MULTISPECIES: hypothetical protein [unclassified Bradyrhizobium]MCP3398931.1 hypothetical protein [Bradyrhizobium sp. CCGB20]MCP3407532.1 hypothetical protein [Bradyrhizobium sp. CCGB01]
MLTTTPPHYTSEAARHRQVAEEFRTMAAHTPHASLREQDLALAQDYDKLADNEDGVAKISEAFATEATL